MSGTKALRKQVVTEIRLRRYFWNILLSLGLVYMAGSMLFGDMGLVRYLQLNERQASIQMELDRIMQQNRLAAGKLTSLSTDNFYVEKNARESFGMSSKDEFVFIFKQ